MSTQNQETKFELVCCPLPPSATNAGESGVQCLCLPVSAIIALICRDQASLRPHELEDEFLDSLSESEFKSLRYEIVFFAPCVMNFQRLKLNLIIL
jgi:hypothetical protein